MKKLTRKLLDEVLSSWVSESEVEHPNAAAFTVYVDNEGEKWAVTARRLSSPLAQSEKIVEFPKG